MEPSVLSRCVTVGGSDFLVYHLGDLSPAGRGQVVEFSLRLREIRPERRVAVAVTVCELDGEGQPCPRGTKAFTVPPHHEEQPRDIEVDAVRFILPGDLDVSTDGRRRLSVQAECHYVDQNGCCVLTLEPQ